MDDELKDHIAEPVSLQARAMQNDDWVELHANKETIKRTGDLSWVKLKDATIARGPAKKITSARIIHSYFAV